MESNPEKFCPIANTTCRHNECMMHKEGECLIASALESVCRLTEIIDESVDPEQLKDAVHFFATLDNAPIYEITKHGNIPWLRVRAKVESVD